MTTDVVETTETENDTTTAQTVGNVVVLSFAIIGAVQTTRFAVRKVRDAVRLVKEARTAETIESTPSES